MSLTKQQKEHLYILQIQKVLRNSNFTDILNKKKFCDVALKYYSEGYKNYIHEAQQLTGLGFESTEFCPDNI
jgi:hypothetical protein